MTRYKAIKILEYQHKYGNMEEEVRQALAMAIEALQNRPSGKWTNLYEDGHGFWCGTCDHCGKEGDVSMFCPNCGADMRGDDDGHDKEG